jgi:ABC-type nitrate/sulfonate/bicarbonate transport system substrate-binding protein
VEQEVIMRRMISMQVASRQWAARRRLGMVVAVVAVAVSALAVGCGDSDESAGGSESPRDEDVSAGDEAPPDEPVTIRMGWGIPAEEIKYVMMQRPELAEHLGTWYEIEWHQFAGTPPGVQGLASDTLDCATVGGLSVANGLERGADIVLLGEFIEERESHFSTAWMTTESSGIDSLDDLEGRKVATVSAGASTDYVQDYYIEEQTGLVAGEDYEKVEVPFAQMQETLLSGRIDVGLFPQPFYDAVNATGEVKPLFRLTDQIDGFVQLMNGCRRDFVEDNREVIEKFQQDWFAIADWVMDPANRDEVVDISAETTGMPADALDRFLLGDEDYFRPEHGVIDTAAVQAEWDFFLDRGGLQEPLSVDDHVIPELLEP